MPLYKRAANAETVRELIDAAFAARYHDVPLMLRVSSQAVALAEEQIHSLPSDLVVAAWTQYGNALRITGRYPEAKRALERAAALEPRDLHTKVHLLEIEASLHRATRNFGKAESLLKTAIDLQRSIDNSNSEARTQNLLGIVYSDCANWPKAISAFQVALDLLDPDAPVDVLVATGHNLFEALIAAGRLSAAASFLVILEPFHSRLTSPRLQAKAHWMRARLCRQMNQFSAARIAYERAHALLSTEPRVPELAELLGEIADLPHEAPKGPDRR